MATYFNIDIELFTGPGAAAADSGRVQEEVAKGVQEFWSGLGLPAEPVVTVTSSAEARELFDFSLCLDGQWAPTPVCQDGFSAAPLAFRILSTIFEHRVRLISDEQLRQLRAQCLEQQKTATSWSSAPLPVWRSLATLLLQNGFSLDRLSACFENWSPGKNPEEAFERLIENFDALRLSLTVHPQLAAAHPAADPGWEARFPEVYREVYQELGIILPQLSLETDDALSFEQFRLRLNDLWLPVLPGLGATQQLYTNPAAAKKIYLPGKSADLALEPEQDNVLQTPAIAGPWAYVQDWVKYWVARCAGWYVNTGIVDTQMDQLEESNRSLIIMIREQWPTYRLCAILRRLLLEGVSIRNLPEILDVLLRIDGPLAVDDTQYLPYFPPVSRVVVVPPGAPSTDLTDDQLVGQVRANLKYPVVYPYMQGGVLPCYTFDPTLLRDFREGFFRETAPGPGSVFQALLQKIAEQTLPDFPRPVFLVMSSIRPAVQVALRPYFPEMVVLGQEELPAFFIPSVKSLINLP